MNRLKMQCICCSQEVELYRDHISGSDHYRCGNCFEVVDLDDLGQIDELNIQLKQLEEKRHALLAAHRLSSR